MQMICVTYRNQLVTNFQTVTQIGWPTINNERHKDSFPIFTTNYVEAQSRLAFSQHHFPWLSESKQPPYTSSCALKITKFKQQSCSHAPSGRIHQHMASFWFLHLTLLSQTKLTKYFFCTIKQLWPADIVDDTDDPISAKIKCRLPGVPKHL